MANQSVLSRVDDDEHDGRILNDEEFSRAIQHRPDIYSIENTRRLWTIEAISLVVGLIVGFWLNSITTEKIAPDFYRIMLTERMAKLHTEPVARATSKPPQKMIDRGLLKIALGHSRGNTVVTFVASKKNEKQFVHSPNKADLDKAIEGHILSTPQVSPVSAKEDGELVKRGNILKKQENRDQAFAAFRQVLRHDPHNTGALTGMGDAFMYSGWLDSAEAFYKSALAVNPRIAAAHNGLGNAQYYLSIMAANPNFVAMHNISNSRQLISALYDSAIADYTAAISIDSTYVQALTNRGVLRDLRKDHEGAIKDYTLAIRINPVCAEAYSKRASTLAAMGELREAVADYTAAINLDTSGYEFDPKLHFANAYYGRGVAEYKMGDLDGAIADFDSTLALSPKHGPAILNKAIALEDKKNYEEAIFGFTQAIALLSPMEYNGAKRLAYIHRGNIFRALGDCDKAIADYTSALDSSKLAARTCWHIAQCKCLKHENDTALAWLKKSVSFGFKDFDLWKRDQYLAPLRDIPEFLEITSFTVK